MLNSVYSEKVKYLTEDCTPLTETQIFLLKTLKSKSRFEQLMEVLPENWENTHEIKLYATPSEVATAFMTQTSSRPDKKFYERIVLDVVVSANHEAVPGNYDEHLKRDNDNPGYWKIYQGLTTVSYSSFHIDHKLIWITKERRIEPDSDASIENVPYSYCINIYVPSLETLSTVETLKLNKLV